MKVFLWAAIVFDAITGQELSTTLNKYIKRTEFLAYRTSFSEIGDHMIVMMERAMEKNLKATFFREVYQTEGHLKTTLTAGPI